MASSIGERMPRGNFARDKRHHPFQHDGEIALVLGRDVPIGTTRVMSVVPLRYWPPESIKQQPVAFDHRMRRVASRGSAASRRSR